MAGAVSVKKTRDVTNFGRNIRFRPSDCYAPESEQEVLDILARHQGESFRVVGRLHAWSPLTVTSGVCLDLRKLNQVRIQDDDGRVLATVGGGCQIKRMLVELRRLANVTSPSVGLITEQTIAGAISTGTHGSGKHSLSHYMREIRVATYDSNGQPEIRSFDSGDELRAARCSLGLLGIILSVSFDCRPAYLVEEHVRLHDSLSLAVAEEAAYPLQQIFVIPWSWHVFGQHRREIAGKPNSLAYLARIYWLLGIDIGLHLILLTLAKLLRSNLITQFFYQKIFSGLVLQNLRIVDESERVLVMEHELFRHIEMELFVPCDKLTEAVGFVEDVIRGFGGHMQEITRSGRKQLEQMKLWDSLVQSSGTYCHHYPICIRRILADDTLISMASGDTTYYSISLISYQRLSDRENFDHFTKFLATAMEGPFEARVHWGKLCPQDAGTLQRLYPRLEEFKRICEQHDPQAVFRNSFVADRLGLPSPNQVD